MARWVATHPVNFQYAGHDYVGPAGTIFWLEDELQEQFAEWAPGHVDCVFLNTNEWDELESRIDTLELSGHPNLAAHESIGLVTETDLDAHEDALDPHIGYATNEELAAHTAAGDPHTAYERKSQKGLANGYAGLDADAFVPDQNIPFTITRDTELSAHTGAVLSVHGIANTADLATDADVSTAIADHTVNEPHDGGGSIDYAEAADLAASNFGDTADAGVSTEVPRADHKHPREANPVTAHEAAANPHPTYLTQAEGDGLYSAPHEHPYEPSGAVATHEGAADPHTGYLRENDANWADLTDGGETNLHSHAGGGSVPDPWEGSYTPGSFTVPTGDFGFMVEMLELTTTQAATLEGTAVLRIA